LGEEEMKIPDLIGMTYEEAKVMLDAQGLSGIVIVDPNVKDTTNSFVYRQSPMPRTADGVKQRIRSGQMIDIWVGVERPVVDTLNQQPLNQQLPQ